MTEQAKAMGLRERLIEWGASLEDQSGELIGYVSESELVRLDDILAESEKRDALLELARAIRNGSTLSWAVSYEKGHQ